MIKIPFIEKIRIFENLDSDDDIVQIVFGQCDKLINMN